MQYDAGIDVSLEQSSVCVVDAAGKIVKEAKVATDPHVLVTFFKGLGFPVTRIGLEAGPLSQWLYAGLTQAGFDVVLLETRHVKAALSAMVVKTDRKDARGIAQLIRMAPENDNSRAMSSRSSNARLRTEREQGNESRQDRDHAPRPRWCRAPHAGSSGHRRCE
jgi:transposase